MPGSGDGESGGDACETKVVTEIIIISGFRFGCIQPECFCGNRGSFVVPEPAGCLGSTAADSVHGSEEATLVSQVSPGFIFKGPRPESLKYFSHFFLKGIKVSHL